MKTENSRGYFILSATFFAVALIWFLWIRNRAVGIVWLATAVVELAIALRVRRREKEEP